ncbi:hypothetical protein [Gilvibacter sp.]|uniref:hypothetical protein n=1 Tax=Gilvibacter sp. TaxID=2729997 RepID=UPI003F49D9FB
MPNTIFAQCILVFQESGIDADLFVDQYSRRSGAAISGRVFRSIFEFYENLKPEDAKVFYPNDYGSTNPLGTTTTEGFTLDYFRFSGCT